MSRLTAQQIWTDYASQIRKFLAKRVPCPEDAEDLLQDVLLKTHRHLQNHPAPERMPAWLFQVTRNTLTDYYRTRSTTPNRLDISECMDIPEEPPDAQARVHRELSRCLEPFLWKLPDQYRAAINAVDLSGMSQKDLAQSLGVSHSAVKSRVQRGRRMLGKLFRACCSFEMDARGNIRDFVEQSGSD